MDFKKLGLFAAGTLFGTAGIKILTSKDARKVYTEATAAALRAKECVMTTVTNVQEGAGDILADAKAINDHGGRGTSAPPQRRAGRKPQAGNPLTAAGSGASFGRCRAGGFAQGAGRAGIG